MVDTKAGLNHYDLGRCLTGPVSKKGIIHCNEHQDITPE